MAIGTYMSIITLNVNGLNDQPKDTDWLNGYKNKTHIYPVYKKHLQPQDTYRLNVRGWKNMLLANVKQKKAEVAIVMSDKIDLKVKSSISVRGSHYLMIRLSYALN